MGHWVEASLKDKVAYRLCFLDHKTVARLYNEIIFEEDDNYSEVHSMENFNDIISEKDLTPVDLARHVANGKFDRFDDWFVFDEYGDIRTFPDRDFGGNPKGVDYYYIAEGLIKYADINDEYKGIVESAIKEYEGGYDVWVEDETA